MMGTVTSILTKLSNLFFTVLKDVGLAKTIEESKDTEVVSRSTIFKILDGKHEG